MKNRSIPDRNPFGKHFGAIKRLSERFFSDLAEREAFQQAMLTPQPRVSALIWMAEKEPGIFQEVDSNLALPEWISLVAKEASTGEDSPGKSEQHQSGKFYCLDPSSVEVMLPILDLVKQGELGQDSVVLDFCAAPGGKSIFAYRAIQPKLLIANEYEGKRIPALLSNLKRCRLQSAVVTRSDPKHFSNCNSAVADLLLVDAPCTGQSLLAKGEKALGAFSKPVINLNVGRQRRILAEASKLVRAGGYLLYSTCTFSLEENENNVKWFLKNFPNYSLLQTARSWPHTSLGAGSFYALFKRDSQLDAVRQEIDLSSLKHWQLDIA